MVPITYSQKANGFYLKRDFQVIVEAPGFHGETWIQMEFTGSDTTISLSGFQGIICKKADSEAGIAELKAKGMEVGKNDNTS